MSALTPAVRSAPRARPFAKLLRTELRLFLREPMALFWGVAFPVVLLVVLGLASSGKPEKSLGGLELVIAYTPIVMVFVVAILSLNALPAVLASYRDKGYLRPGTGSAPRPRAPPDARRSATARRSTAARRRRRRRAACSR